MDRAATDAIGCLTVGYKPLSIAVSEYVKYHLQRRSKMEAQWSKLKSGDWGVRIRFTGQAGNDVVVVTKDGKESTAKLKSRVARFDDAELWEVEK